MCVCVCVCGGGGFRSSQCYSLVVSRSGCFLLLLITNNSLCGLTNFVRGLYHNYYRSS